MRTNVSNLSIGLVTSPSEESKQLIKLLESSGIQVTYHISPEEIEAAHIENTELNVWLLNVDDDHWHDNIDQLLEESEASIYFNEPDTLARQSHPEYWCQNLVSRLYEITGLANDSATNTPKDNGNHKVEESQNDKSGANHSEVSNSPLEAVEESNEHTLSSDSSSMEIEGVDELSSALDNLETSSIGLSSEIAADLVSELESISPDLETPLENSITLPQNHSINEVYEEEITPDNSLLDGEIANIDENTQLNESPSVDNSVNNDSADIEKESNQIGNEILELAGEQPEQVSNIADSNVLIEEIDFSNSSIPVLESVRDDDARVLQSNYGSETEKNKSKTSEEFVTDEEMEFNLEEPLGEIESGESLELEEDLGDFTLQELELSLEEQPDVDKRSDEISLEINNFESEEEPQEKIETELNLSLEDKDTSEKISGKSVFIDEEAIESLSEESIEEEDISSAEIGLSLESMEDQVVKAGKAQFSIDDKPKYSEEEVLVSAEKENTSVQEVVNQESELSTRENEIEETFALSLEPVDTNDKPECLEPAMSEDPAEEIEVEQLVTAKSDDVMLTESEEIKSSSSQTISEDIIEPMALEDLNSLPNDEESFEIPMLEDAAMGLDFEEVSQVSASSSQLTPCWVIGASLGGPAAVKRFIQKLPAEINASFIVVQHIDENFLPVLADILSTSSAFDVKVANGSNPITPGKIYLAPLKGKLIFLQDGSMLVDRSQKWSEPYSPCIDDVIESLAAVYGELSGAIIFSGMGEDGLNGAKKMHLKKGKVWAQSTDTCANASMPEAVINEGLSSVVGSPEDLADELVKYLD